LTATAETWTNDSVLRFANGREPVQALVEAARDLILKAIDEGWSGPPFDPMQLADLRGIHVSPRGDIPDARTVSLGQNRLVIEYNPTRPNGRVRYSIAHEIAHTLFPDCAAKVRNRGLHGGGKDDWQLEALCNIAAAEILMPVGSMKTDDVGVLDINTISETRKRFDVSTEAVLIRLAHLSDEPCAVFTASRREASHGSSTYWFDYIIPTRSWKHNIRRGTRIPDPSPASECTAIGFTAKGNCEFPAVSENIRMECIGIPPYPGAIFPRIAGFLAGRKRSGAQAPGIHFVRGDVLKPRGTDRRLIAHVVSDATPNWGGGGVAMALKNKWPAAQEKFREWVGARRRPSLGEVHFCQVAENIEVASLVCQHGYGPSSRGPRLRLAALESALTAVAEHAKLVNASVHMPRIGCGQAGGSWVVVQELIAISLVAANAPVTVYDLPEAKDSGITQLSLLPSTQRQR